MEGIEKKKSKEMMSTIAELENENTIDAQYRALEIAESLEEGKLKNMAVKGVASKLTLLLDQEGSDEARAEALELKKQYFGHSEPEDYKELV